MPTDVLTGITCVLFDMDGVLIDVSRSYRSAIARTAETFTGRRVTPERIQTFKNRGGFNDDWELTHALIRDEGVAPNFEDVVREFQRLYRGSDWDGLITEETPLLQRAVLADLTERGADLGVVTGRPEEEANWTLDHFGWSDLFSVVVAREQQGDRPKPDGYPITLALSGLRRSHRPAATVYVGDTPDDVHSAINAGVIPVGFVPPYLDPVRHADLLRSNGARIVISHGDPLPRVLGLE